ncbi:glycoside hydrolase family 88 protein [Halorarius litoreus]|uniref:glycoside hydrolase family 88 protein n=1 Tax=Halorarius litoreus TaxID=2962676 RepID=UPI0020CC88FD|nr:glycoside hydrolase family 88 protein [Halorarius litoreus]
MTAELSKLVGRVADNIVERDMENEDWEKGAAVNGLLSVGAAEYDEAAHRIADRAVATQTSEGVFNYDDPKPWLHGEDIHRAQCEPATLGHVVLEFYERTQDERYLDAARRQYEHLRDDAKRTAEGCLSYTTGPVAVWVDSVYMICPWFARYAGVTGDAQAYDEAAAHIEDQAYYLQDHKSGLFRHEWRETPDTFPESSLWARGNGWVCAGTVDTLAHLPEDHDRYDAVVDIFQGHAASLYELQDDSGLWHHILDYPDSPLETSATLQFAYTFKRGADAGLLPAKYERAAERAFEVCMDLVNDDGEVRRVAVPPGGPDAPLDETSYGGGWFLMAADVLG